MRGLRPGALPREAVGLASVELNHATMSETQSMGMGSIGYQPNGNTKDHYVQPQICHSDKKDVFRHFPSRLVVYFSYMSRFATRNNSIEP